MCVKNFDESKNPCQESNQNWGSHAQEEGTYFKGAFLPVLPLKSQHMVLIMRIINMIINMDDIRQERPNKSPILKLKKKT